jgi:membrane-associated phospholipid phosphatase
MRRLATGIAVWVVFAAGLYLHSVVRGQADDLGRPVLDVGQIEQAVFNGLPTVWLQDWIGTSNAALTQASVMVYGSFFLGPILLAAFIHFRCGTLAAARLLALELMCFFAADLIFAVMPASPPWLTLDVVRVLGGHSASGTPLDNNVVAAIPSLHLAIPAVFALYFYRQTDRWVRGASAIVALWALATSFVVVYGAEHYVIDVIAGALFGAVVYAAGSSLLDRISRRQNHPASAISEPLPTPPDMPVSGPLIRSEGHARLQGRI